MDVCPNQKCNKGTVQCVDCSGKGYQWGIFMGKNPCKTCNSAGFIQCHECHPCPNCNGTGKSWILWCASCNGTGRVDKLTLSQRGDQHLKNGQFSIAKKYFERAVNQGDSDAMYYLGVMYEQGMGVQRNHDAAQQWFSKARSKGHSGAKMEIKNARPRNWKATTLICSKCGYIGIDLRHRDCPRGILGSKTWFDIEYFEIRCDKCDKIWPLENNVSRCGKCGNEQKTEYTKETIVVGKDEKIIHTDGDIVYKVDRSGRIIAGRTTYHKGVGYIR